MPKSRKRKQAKRIRDRRRSSRRRSLRPGECVDTDPRKLDELLDEVMTPEDIEALEASSAAEAAGDASTALERRLEAPYVVGSMQLAHLQEIIELGTEAPGWVINRWILGQAERWLMTSGDPRVQEAVITTWIAAWDTDMEPPEGWPFRAFGTALAASDWIAHQLMDYELGGLRDFIDVVASDELLARSDHIEEWAAAPMGGYRLEEMRGDRLVITDLAADRRLELLNLGALTDFPDQPTVLGRVVPISCEPGLMFDRRPVAVDEVTARQVAEAGTWDVDMAWIGVIAGALGRGRLTPGFSQSSPTLLCSDVVVHQPEHDHDHDHPPRELPGRVRALMEDGLTERVASAVCTCEVALIAVTVSGEHAAATMGSIITPALIDRDVFAALREHAVGPEHELHWKQLAKGVAEPARTRCLELSILCRRAA